MHRALRGFVKCQIVVNHHVYSYPFDIARLEIVQEISDHKDEHENVAYCIRYICIRNENDIMNKEAI